MQLKLDVLCRVWQTAIVGTGK